MNKYIATALAASALLAVPAFAQNAIPTATNDVVVLSDFEAAPDGVSVVALGEDAFKVLAIATAPYRADAPAAISAARTVAVAKAQGALSRFLDEKVELEDFLEKEVSKVRIISSDGTVSASQAVSRRVLTRIRTSSKSLLRGVIVLQTETIPDAEGTGGSFRALIGASSASLAGSESFESGIENAGPSSP